MCAHGCARVQRLDCYRDGWAFFAAQTRSLHTSILRIGSETHNPAMGKNQPQSGRTLHLERTLAASPERVFAACVEAEKLAQWWGPAGFTSPSVQLDVRKGGRY